MCHIPAVSRRISCAGDGRSNSHLCFCSGHQGEAQQRSRCPSPGNQCSFDLRLPAYRSYVQWRVHVE